MSSQNISHHVGSFGAAYPPPVPLSDLPQSHPPVEIDSALAERTYPRREASPTLDPAREGYLPASPGLNIARAHGITDDRPVLTAINFAASHQVGPLPAPSADQYLQNSAVPAARRGEIPITLTLQEGLLSYYRGNSPHGRLSFQLLEPDQRVIEVNPEVGPGTVLGYPYVDALTCARRQPELFQGLEDAVAVAAFPTKHFRDSIPSNLQAVQSFDPAPANDKSRFREGVAQRGVTIVPGIHAEHASDLDSAVTQFHSASRVWLKVPGSGGDLVLPIPGPVTREALLQGIERLRAEVGKAFQANHYDLALDAYWPEDRVAPLGTKLVIEQDLRDMGKVLMNGGISVAIDRHGRYSALRTFRQIVDPSTGEFRGGAAVDVRTENDPVVLDLFRNNRGGGLERLHAQLQGVASHVAEDLNFCGVWGADFWLVEHADGEVHPYWCELNGRPTMNYIPWTIAEKLGPGAFVNVNIWCAHQLHSIADLERAVGAELLYGDPDRGLVVPIAMRSIQLREPDGALRVVLPSNAAKILVCGRDMNMVDGILEQLHQRGVRYDARAYAF